MKGHIRERSPGHWAIVVDARDPQTGKRKRRWHSFQGTKRQAQIECARLVTEIETGAAVDPTRITLSEFLDRFERDWISIHVTPASAKRYKLSLAYARQRLGGRRLQTLRAADLAAFYAAFSQSLAPRTVRHAHLVLHKAFEQARLWGLLRDNPADLAKPPPIPETEISILQPDQARELLERLRGHELYMLAALALATGARRNELLGLRWSDLDLNTGRMRIEQALEQASGAVQVKSPKTRAGRRTLTLPPAMVAELRAHWVAQQEQRMALGLGRSPADGFVLAAIDGGPQRPDPLSKRWGETMDRLGMPEITLHSLRHTHASMLIAAGMDILTVSRRLGHASPTITLNTYGHTIHGTDDRAAQILDQALGSKMVADGSKEPGNLR
jgi:integrase